MPWNLPVLPNANLRGTRLNVISISLIFYPVFIDHFGINWPTVEDYLPWSNLDRAGYKFQSLTVLWRKASTTTTASTLFDKMHGDLDSMSQLVPMHRNHIVTTKCILLQTHWLLRIASKTIDTVAVVDSVSERAFNSQAKYRHSFGNNRKWFAHSLHFPDENINWVPQ